MSDLVTEFSRRVIGLEWPDKALAFLVAKLSDIEMRLSHGASEKLQLGAMVGAFILSRDIMTRAGG